MQNFVAYATKFCSRHRSVWSLFRGGVLAKEAAESEKGAMYEESSILIAGLLFVSLLVAIEVGYRVGRRAGRGATEHSRTHVNTVQASLLGVLALLLGFSFSLALQRYESRSVAVIDEANAIGTAYLRADLLPDALRERTQELLRNYLDLRLQAGSIALIQSRDREVLLARLDGILQELWGRARQAAAEDDRPVTSGLFIESVNELIDSYGRRNATLQRHVPGVVLWLLFGTFLFTATVVGYAAGLAGHRASFVTYMMVGLIVMLVFVIIDLDRPRRGMIEVSQASLLDLQTSMHKVPAP